MEINPIDRAITNGERPDFTKYDKRTIIASDYFNAIAENASEEQDAREQVDPTFQARMAESQKVETAVVRELQDAGYASIDSIDDIVKAPPAHAKAVEILAEYLKVIDDPSLTWGISLRIQDLKPKDTMPLTGALEVMLSSEVPMKHRQAVFALVQTIKSSKGKEAIGKAATLLRAVDDPAAQAMLKRLDSTR